jgi:hypothetical protein
MGWGGVQSVGVGVAAWTGRSLKRGDEHETNQTGSKDRGLAGHKHF